MTISPVDVTSVCRGDQLELTCTTTGSLLQWSFLIPKGEMTATTYSRILTTSSSLAVPGLLVNSVTLSFIRVSAQNTLPLIATVLINPVSAELNGTLVNCSDIDETESTLVRIVNEDLIFGRLQKLKVINCLKFIPSINNTILNNATSIL